MANKLWKFKHKTYGIYNMDSKDEVITSIIQQCKITELKREIENLKKFKLIFENSNVMKQNNHGRTKQKTSPILSRYFVLFCHDYFAS